VLVWSFAEHHCVLLAELLLVTVPLSLSDIGFQQRSEIIKQVMKRGHELS